MKLSRATSIFLLILVLLCACSSFQNPSPSQTLTNYYDAVKRSDAEAAKKCLSKTSLSLLALTAKNSGVAIDDIFSPRYFHDFKQEIIGEQINGDTATVKIKDGDKIVEMPFVKEDGAWKIALEKASDLRY